MASYLTGLSSFISFPGKIAGGVKCLVAILFLWSPFFASAADDVQFPKTIAWSAYQTGTGGYSQAVAIGNILQRQYGTNLRVIPGRNDVSRLATLRAGRVHFSAGGSEAVYAQEGILNFASKIWGPQPIRALMSNYSDSCSYTMVTATDANIRTIADVKGKRVTFVQGAPSLNNAMAALLSYANLSWDDVERVEVGGYNASADAVVNNRADVVGGACNSPPFLRLEASPRGLTFPEFPHDDEDAIKRVRDRLPWYVPHIAIEGPTIPTEGIEVFTSAYPLLVGLDTSDETLVYSTVKIMHENYETYKDNAPGASGWRMDRQKFEQAFIPFHPGAIRYYREIGEWTEAAEATHQANLHRQSILKTAWDVFVPGAPENYVEFEQAWLLARETALAEAGLITLGEGL
ncbi:MAG: TAXI family TRAP transporter solute-binding subunit [Gammaproteobacteria bacterium]|nr:TAXI family TRAP transporter solute-binding subunit [Gammaproteobacteria bacterium]MDD9895592.1 TAXI family TRAP transporter solute-binding subunit [Gammaproteobacteria bacterium]MDD9959710.1 TAXI family TRAP transporter solute-binding subunit [Gammaproteobacteria bacterium]